MKELYTSEIENKINLKNFTVVTGNVSCEPTINARTTEENETEYFLNFQITPKKSKAFFSALVISKNKKSVLELMELLKKDTEFTFIGRIIFKSKKIKDIQITQASFYIQKIIDNKNMFINFMYDQLENSANF